MFGRNKVAMIVAEFLGTYALASAVLMVAGAFFGGATAGLTLAVMVLVIGAISGAHINPAVTIGLWSIRKVPTIQASIFVAAQMLAGFAAFAVNQYLLDTALPNIAKVGWDWRVVIGETLGALIFGFGIAAAVYSAYEGGRLAAAIGGSLFVGILVASAGSNGILNPAVAVGLNSVSASYLIAPVVGVVAGMNLYAQVFAPQPAPAKVAKPTRRKR